MASSLLSLVICEGASMRSDGLWDLRGVGLLEVPKGGGTFVAVATVRGPLPVGDYVIRAYTLKRDGSRTGKEGRLASRVEKAGPVTVMTTTAEITASAATPDVLRVVAEVERVSPDGTTLERLIQAEVLVVLR